MPVMFPKTYPIKKANVGIRIKGRSIDEDRSTKNLVADIQPLNSYEISRLDIGDRGLGKVKIYTDDVLNISDKSSETPGDYIKYDGEWYEVLMKDKHSGIMQHNKYIAEARKDESI